jgi:hypothetical protein
MQYCYLDSSQQLKRFFRHVHVWCWVLLLLLLPLLLLLATTLGLFMRAVKLHVNTPTELAASTVRRHVMRTTGGLECYSVCHDCATS